MLFFLPSSIHSVMPNSGLVNGPQNLTHFAVNQAPLAPYNLYGHNYRDVSSIDVNFFFLFWHVLIFIYTFLRSFFSFLKIYLHRC